MEPEIERGLFCGECKEPCEVDFKEWNEPRGEFWGMPCSEHMCEYSSKCCNAEVFTKRQLDTDETPHSNDSGATGYRYVVFDEAEPEDVRP